MNDTTPETTSPSTTGDDPIESGAEIEPAESVEVASAEAETGESATSDAGGDAGAEGDADADAKDGAKRPARRRPRDPSVIRAFRAGLPVEGKVERVIKGGYEVRVGRLRGFCPHSQMDMQRVENPEEHVGQTYAWRILQLRRGGEDVVVSRRALLEEERGEEAKAVRATLLEGAVTSGHVVRVADFGAFVDLGAGVTGLVHLTEIAHSRVNRPSDVLAPGDFVTVKILKIDDASGRISLSIKQAQEDPWRGVAGSFQEGQRVTAAVSRLVDFGAFVEISPGVEALAPARELPPVEEGWRDRLAPGKTCEWVVLSVDEERRRISVLPADAAGAAVPPEQVVPGAMVSGRVQKCESFGVFVWLGPGRVGLMPKVWTGVPYGQPFEPKFPIGAETRVEIVEISEDGKRIRLAAEGVARRESQDDTRRAGRSKGGRRAARDDEHARGSDSRDAAPDTPPAPFGTHLGEALKAALGRREEG